MCRPQVIKRRDTWVKFGKVAKVPRNKNLPGEIIIADTPIMMENDEG